MSVDAGKKSGDDAAAPLILEEEFDLVERLGTGQYGEVWKGTRMANTNHHVAVKIFKKICRSETVANELRIMKQLHEVNSQSRNLVDVVETNIMNSNGRKCLVLEYLGGKELFDRIVDKGYYTEKEAATTVAALARALHLLHSKQIIHRDLKPENIVYRSADANADAVIVDFGFAIIARNTLPDGTCYHEDANAFTPLGTHGYISPESYERCLYTSKSDMWALGVVTYTVLVGFPPFDSKDKQLSLRTRRGKYYPLSSAPWKNISNEAKDLVSKMLCVDVAKRLSAEEVLDHPWVRKHVASDAKPSTQDDGLGKEYLERLQRLQTKQKFKKAVNGIVWSIRLRKAAVQAALRQSQAEEEAELEVDEATVASSPRARNMGSGTETDNVLPRVASNTGLQAAANAGGKQSTQGSDQEPLVVSLDQIQRLASGLSRNASYKMGRNDSTPFDSPGLPTAGVKRLNRKGSAGILFGSGLDSTSSLQVEADDINSASRTPSVAMNVSVPAEEKGHEHCEDDIRPRMKRMSSSVLNTFNEGGGVNYEEFCSAVVAVGMPMLATRHVFEAFDQSGTGVVSVTEFMSTMVGFRGDIMQANKELPSSSAGAGGSGSKRAESKPEDGTPERSADLKKMKCEFFFNIFDLDGSGFISREELFHVVAVLLSDVEDAEKNTFVRKHRKSLDGNPAAAAAAAADRAASGQSSPAKPRNSFASITQLTGMGNNEESEGVSSRERSSTATSTSTSPKRGPRDSLSEELLDFPPEHHNNLTIGNEGVEIDFNSLFESIDTDGSGEISYEEFEAWFNHGDSAGLFVGLLDDIDAVQARFKEHFGETFAAAQTGMDTVDARAS